MRQHHIDRRTRLFAHTSTPTLVEAARKLDTKKARDSLSSHEQRAYAWTCDELERRAGGITDDAAFEQLMDSTDAPYVELLLMHFPNLPR